MRKYIVGVYDLADDEVHLVQMEAHNSDEVIRHIAEKYFDMDNEEVKDMVYFEPIDVVVDALEEELELRISKVLCLDDE